MASLLLGSVALIREHADILDLLVESAGPGMAVLRPWLAL